MVRLDAVLRFEDVGVDRPLSEELYALEFSRLLGEDLDEDTADDLALSFGIRHARERVKEAVDGVDVDEIDVELLAEHAADLLGLALAEKSVIDVDAAETAADGL